MNHQSADHRFKLRSFTHPLARKPWHYLIVDSDDQVPANRWYQRQSWKSPNCVRYQSEWPDDWETFSEEEMVSGVSERNRTMCFFLFSARPDFRIFLEPDPEHPDDKHAIKVMASATLKDLQADVRLGYLSGETARALQGVGEVDARPYSVYLPRDDGLLRVGVRVLIRPLDRSIPRSTASGDAAISQSVRRAVFDGVYEYFNGVRDVYHCQAVPESLFRRAFDPYFDDAIEERCLTEEELDNPGLANELDFNLADVMITEMLPCIVETLIETNPDLDTRQ